MEWWTLRNWRGPMWLERAKFVFRKGTSLTVPYLNPCGINSLLNTCAWCMVFPKREGLEKDKQFAPVLSWCIPGVYLGFIPNWFIPDVQPLSITFFKESMNCFKNKTNKKPNHNLEAYGFAIFFWLSMAAKFCVTSYLVILWRLWIFFWYNGELNFSSYTSQLWCFIVPWVRFHFFWCFEALELFNGKWLDLRWVDYILLLRHL